MESIHLVDNNSRKTVMNANLSNLSELANILSVKSSVGANLLTLFNRFGLGHLLCRMSLEWRRSRMYQQYSSYCPFAFFA